MGRRHPNPRLAKIHRSYSVDDVARLFRIHKNTVRSWLKCGLHPIDDRRPVLVRGQEVRRFLVERKVRAKQTCGPGRIFCLPCRKPQVPAGGFAECFQTSDRIATLHAICPVCDRMIYRRVNPEQLDAVRGDLEIAINYAPHRGGGRVKSQEPINVQPAASRSNAKCPDSHFSAEKGAMVATAETVIATIKRHP